MNKEKFNILVSSSEKNIQSVDIEDLNKLKRTFPYCYLIHYLLLIKLSQERNYINIDEKITRASIYSYDRKTIYNLFNKKYKLEKKSLKFKFTYWLKNLTKESERSVENFSEISINKSISDNDNLTTETLAELYFSQGHNERAIQAYKILSLKYPKKSSLFANRIKYIKSKTI